MSLQNYQYDIILRQYDALRLRSKYQLDKRTERIYNECPEIMDIDNRIAAESIARAKRAIMGESGALVGLAADNERLSKRKETILVNHGYPADYLKPHYECELCHDMGFIGRERCICFKRALSKLVYNESNIRDIVEKENFNSFDYSLFSDDPCDTDPESGLTPRASILKTVSYVKEFIRNFDHEHQNLMLCGNTGVGKTFLSNCIAKELLDSGHTVIYYTAYHLFDYLAKAKFSNDRSFEDDEMTSPDKLVECDLLIIDDLGTELTNSFTVSSLFAIVNERILKNRSTIITTNLDWRTFTDKYSERIASRIGKEYTFLYLAGNDIRSKL